MKKAILIFTLFVMHTVLLSQNTVGIISNSSGSYNGYTLFTPLTSTETYLINNCGQIINQWSSDHLPGASVYLLENGNLLRTARIDNPSINFGGVGGKIELFDWDGNLLWSYIHASTTFIQHHDVYPLPNGNILVLSAEVMPESEALQEGRNPSLLTSGEIYNEQVIEIEPIGTNQVNIVWEWNIKDHLIQDFDATKNNYGVVEDNPQLLDFNFTNSTSSSANWLHINSLQYNETLDQIVLSSRILSEIYIIDHSTTSAEAASHSGGLYNKGGDILYRWGNPEAYRHGDNSDRTLFGQHYPHWIPNGYVDEGKIIIFNNGQTFSSIDIIEPPATLPGFYDYNETTGYGPVTANWQYTAPVPTDFYSSFISGAQRLPNGNTLICSGASGYFFEIDINENIVWEYINPDSQTGIITQGSTPSLNTVFRAMKFSPDYPAFDGRDLTPGNPIELNPDLSNCTLLNTEEYILSQLSVYPNPTKNMLIINHHKTIESIEIYSLLGKLVTRSFNSKSIDLQHLTNGVYIAKINIEGKFVSKKIIKN